MWLISSCQGLSFGLGLLGCVLAGRILFVFYFGVFLFVPEFCKLNVQLNRGTWNGNSFILQDLQFWVVFLILYQLCQWVTTIDREIVIFFLSVSERALHFLSLWPSLVTQMVMNLPVMRESQVWSLGREDPLEKGMATHSSILARRIPWIEEPGGLQSMGSQRVGHNRATDICTCMHVFFILYQLCQWLLQL